MRRVQLDEQPGQFDKRSGRLPTADRAYGRYDRCGRLETRNRISPPHGFLEDIAGTGGRPTRRFWIQRGSVWKQYRYIRLLRNNWGCRFHLVQMPPGLQARIADNGFAGASSCSFSSFGFRDFDKHRLKPPVGVLPFMPQPRRGHLFGVTDHGFVTVRASVFHPGPQVSAGIGSIRSRP